MKKAEKKFSERHQKCVFTRSIADTLQCSHDGKFDSNGFSVNKCKFFPCSKLIKYKQRIKED